MEKIKHLIKKQMKTNIKKTEGIQKLHRESESVITFDKGNQWMTCAILYDKPERKKINKMQVFEA